MISLIKLRQGFSLNVITTISGTVISQLLPIMIIPILTRLYSPSDFGTFSLFVALATICAVMATARYELTIMLPKRDRGAANLFVLSLVISGLISLLLLLIVSCVPGELVRLTGNPSIKPWLFFIPCAVFCTGVIQTLSFWSNRKQLFSQTAKAKICQGAGLSSAQLILSSKKTAWLGLISGYLLGLVSSAVYLLINVCKKEKGLLKHVSIKRMITYMVKYKNFPIYSLWGAMLDSIATQMPVFMLSKFYDPALTGIFSLTFRTLNLPMVLVAASIAQVLFQKIASVHNIKPELIYKLIWKVFFALTVLSIPFVLVIFFFSDYLFILFFGAKWTLSGHYASTIVFAVVIRFIVSPLSSVLALEHNIKLGFAWQLSYFCTITLTLYKAAQYSVDVFVLVFVIHELVLYSLYLYLILLGTKRYKNH